MKNGTKPKSQSQLGRKANLLNMNQETLRLALKIGLHGSLPRPLVEKVALPYESSKQPWQSINLNSNLGSGALWFFSSPTVKCSEVGAKRC